jgi:hypothetical protein
LAIDRFRQWKAAGTQRWFLLAECSSVVGCPSRKLPTPTKLARRDPKASKYHRLLQGYLNHQSSKFRPIH